jgi:hypothetical protein
MKTAEECLDMIAAAYHCPDVAITETIRLIQLDAMKEGMRRGSEDTLLILDNYLAEGRPHGGRNTAYPDGCECDICQNWDSLNKHRQSILTAAEQLTEKDL